MRKAGIAVGPLLDFARPENRWPRARRAGRDRGIALDLHAGSRRSTARRARSRRGPWPQAASRRNLSSARTARSRPSATPPRSGTPIILKARTQEMLFERDFAGSCCSRRCADFTAADFTASSVLHRGILYQTRQAGIAGGGRKTADEQRQERGESQLRNQSKANRQKPGAGDCARCRHPACAGRRSGGLEPRPDRAARKSRALDGAAHRGRARGREISDRSVAQRPGAARPTILRLAASARTDFVAIARPFLAQLSSELKETVDLSWSRRITWCSSTR